MKIIELSWKLGFLFFVASVEHLIGIPLIGLSLLFSWVDQPFIGSYTILVIGYSIFLSALFSTNMAFIFAIIGFGIASRIILSDWLTTWYKTLIWFLIFGGALSIVVGRQFSWWLASAFILELVIILLLRYRLRVNDTRKRYELR